MNHDWHQLNDMEKRILKDIAKLRGESFPDKAKHHTARLMCKGDTPEEKNFRGNYCGVIGEYWFAKLHGGFFDCIPKKRGDRDEPDVYVGEVGYAVKAAGTTKPYPNLIVEKYKLIEKCDRIALCAVDYDEERVRFVGTIDRDEFMKKQKKRNWPNGPAMSLVLGP